MMARNNTLQVVEGMLVTDEKLDQLIKTRLARVSENKKPIYRPRLKIHKLFGEKRLLTINVCNSIFL